MPELPEVEIIRRQLQPIYRSERIKAIAVRTAALLKNSSAEHFCFVLEGRTIEDVSRLSKYLIFHCQGVYPVFHLGMSGIFLDDRMNSRYPQHIHIEFTFHSGKSLYFQDIRKFGKVWLYETYPSFPGLGIDPLVGDFTVESLAKRLLSRNMNLKLFLMDQSQISGIGNIYANEILFESSLSPYRKTGSLTSREIGALYRAIRRIIRLAIENFGTTYSIYQTVLGESGENQQFLRVYQRENEPCYCCRQPIRRTVLGSRSTFYCNRCQK